MFGTGATTTPGGGAIPWGSRSMKLTPVSATVFSLGFVIVNFKVEISPVWIDGGVNVFVITGGETTINMSEPVFPVPPSIEVIADVVLVRFPPIVETTSTLITQELPGPSGPPPVNLTKPSPGLPPVRVPVQSVNKFDGVATNIPRGKGSSSTIPDCVFVGSGLFIVIVICEGSLAVAVLRFTGFGLNVFVTFRGVTTYTVAVASRPFPPLVEVM